MAREPASEGPVVKFKTCLVATLVGLFLVTQATWAVSVEATGCLASGKDFAGDQTSRPGNKESFGQAYAEAECLRKAAAAERAEWLETESLLQQSLEAADRGEWEEASQLVQKAHFQARTALQQAEHEAEAWKHRVVK